MSREREIVLQRFLELEPGDQFATYRDIRDYLSARLTLVKRDRKVEERAASLEALRQVTAHLGLPPGDAPTPAQFDQASRELDSGWNRSRVKRAWGRWRFAKEAFLGADHDSAKRRELRTAVGGRRRKYEAPRRSIQLWLATSPSDRSYPSYMAWAREYNSQLEDGALPVTTAAHHVSRKLGLTWRDAVRVVAGEISVEEGTPARKKEVHYVCRGPLDLVSTKEAAQILGCTTAWLAKQSAWERFPVPVVDLPRGRLWLREDIEAFGVGGEFPKRRRNEARHLYLTGTEVGELTRLTEMQFTKREGFPEPAVRLGRVRLWLRDEVEVWLKTAGASSGDAGRGPSRARSRQRAPSQR